MLLPPLSPSQFSQRSPPTAGIELTSSDIGPSLVIPSLQDDQSPELVQGRAGEALGSQTIRRQEITVGPVKLGLLRTVVFGATGFFVVLTILLIGCDAV